jgi:uncharacterized protein
MVWEVETLKPFPKLKRAILVEGLPGIGNVGKIAVDFIVEELKPEPICEFYSPTLPHSVFVNRQNLVELPRLTLSLLQRKGKPSLLFLTGDLQPTEEVPSYEFCEQLLDVAQGFNVASIITLGGIGLAQLPKEFRIYITGNSKEAVKLYQTPETRPQLSGIVGPIVGVTGLLLGLAGRRDIPAVAYLSESFAHPLHVGIKEARNLLKLLKKVLKLELNLKEFDEGIKDLEKRVRLKAKDLSELRGKPHGRAKETNYIG